MKASREVRELMTVETVRIDGQHVNRVVGKPMVATIMGVEIGNAAKGTLIVPWSNVRSVELAE